MNHSKSNANWNDSHNHYSNKVASAFSTCRSVRRIDAFNHGTTSKHQKPLEGGKSK